MGSNSLLNSLSYLSSSAQSSSWFEMNAGHLAELFQSACLCKEFIVQDSCVEFSRDG
jgi:hypothetical protein